VTERANITLGLVWTAARVALVTLFIGVTATGFAPIFIRLSELGPVASGFWRFALAMPALWLWQTLERRGEPGSQSPAHTSDSKLLILAGLFFAGDIAAYYWSLTLTSVANASLLLNFAPIFVTLGAWLLFGQRIRLVFIVGLVVVLGGAALLVGTSLRLSPQHLLGDSLGLLAALFLGGYILTVKQLRGNFSSATITLWVAIVCCLALLPLTFLFGEGLLAVTLHGWTMLLGLAWLSQVAGQGLIAFALAHLPATFSSVGLLLQPVVATLLAWAILSEALSPWQALGGLIVLAGIALARQGSLE